MKKTIEGGQRGGNLQGGTNGTPITGNASEVNIGDAAFTSELSFQRFRSKAEKDSPPLSVFFLALLYKGFYDRSLSYRLTAVHGPRQ